MPIKSHAPITYSKWFYISLLLVLLAGLILTIFIRNETKKLIIEDFQYQSEMVASGLNPGIINNIAAAYPENNLAENQRLQQQFDLTMQVFPNYHSISLYGGLVDRNIHVLVSSEEINTADRDVNEPINPEIVTAIKNVFATGESVTVIVPFAEDHNHVSVFSPIIDQNTGTALTVLETATILEPWFSIWSISSLFPIIITMFLSGGLYFFFYLKGRFPVRAPLLNALFAGFVCIQLTAIITFHVFYTESRTHHESFQNLAAIQKRSMMLNLNFTIDTRLDYLSQFFAGSEEVNRSEFKSFTQPFTESLIVDSWRWIPVVSNEKRLELEQNIQSQDRSDFFIWQRSASGRKINAPGEQDDYYPILFIEPQQENSSLIGFDLKSDLTQWAAIAQAAKSGLRTLTYFEESEVSHGLNMYQPIYYSAGSQNLVGFISGDFSLETLFADGEISNVNHNNDQLLLCLYQKSDGEIPLLISNEMSNCEWTPDHPVMSIFQAVFKVEPIRSPFFSGGQVFIMEYKPGQAFNAYFPYTGTITVILSGVIIAVSLSVLINSITNQRAQLKQMVEKRTSELRESEAKFRNLFHNNHTVMLLIDPKDGKIIDANPAASAYYGWSHEELLRKKMTEINILDETVIEKEIQKSFKKKQKRFEFQHRLANGKIRDVESFSGPIKVQGQTLLFAIIHDITNRKHAEEEMNANQQRLRSLVEKLQYQSNNIQDFHDHAVEKAIALTNSKLGYIYFYDEDTQLFTLNSWSKEGMNENQIQNPVTTFQLVEAGMWGEAVRQRKAIVLNDFKAPYSLKISFPEEHGALSRFLIIPIISSGKIVAVVGVANKTDPYTETDILQVTLLMDAIWNIVEQRRFEFELVNSEQKLRELTNATQDIVFLKDAQFRYIMVNEANLKFFNKPEDEVLNKTDFDLMPESSAKNCRESDERTLQENRVVVTIEPLADRIYETRKFPVPLGKEVGIGGFIRDITEQVQAEKITHLQSSALNAAADGMVISGVDNTIEWVNPAFCQMVGYTKEECIGQDISTLLDSDLNPKTMYEDMRGTLNREKIWHGQLLQKRKDGTHFVQEQLITPVRDEKGNVTHYIDVLRDVSEREHRERELRMVSTISAALRTAENRRQIIQNLLDALIKYFEVEGTSIQSIDYERELFITEEGRGDWKKLKGLERPLKQGLSYKVFQSQKPFLSTSLENDVPEQDAQFMENCTSLAAAPLITKKRVIGLLWIGSARKLGENDLRLLTAAANIAANALQRADLFEQTLQKVDQLDALRIIDQTINSSLDLQFTMNVIVEQAKRLLNFDAIAILKYKKDTLVFNLVSEYGFAGEGTKLHQIPINPNMITQILADPHILTEKVLQEVENDPSQEIMDREDLKSLHSAPLTINNQVKGILIVFHHQQFNANQDWLNILKTIAAQTAIAMDRDELFIGLQNANVNLVKAYDETIEGWAHTLEIRDQETEGHSRRVTDMTIALARLMGIQEEHIQDIRRGALLHDIGKMSISDSVLNKAGSLDENEWIMMREHPTIAYHLLSSIEYMKDALVIPYCHHEKWDGSGYPQGLAGDQIPLAARIFAVVDVYDALTSDRPYRKAWSVEDTLKYIREQSGKHFDPQVVSIFLEKIHPDFS